jgi:hypothetical protein
MTDGYGVVIPEKSSIRKSGVKSDNGRNFLPTAGIFIALQRISIRSVIKQTLRRTFACLWPGVLLPCTKRQDFYA